MKCYMFDILKNCKNISSDFEQKYTNKIKQQLLVQYHTTI